MSMTQRSPRNLVTTQVLRIEERASKKQLPIYRFTRSLLLHSFDQVSRNLPIWVFRLLRFNYQHSQTNRVRCLISKRWQTSAPSRKMELKYYGFLKELSTYRALSCVTCLRRTNICLKPRRCALTGSSVGGTCTNTHLSCPHLPIISPNIWIHGTHTNMEFRQMCAQINGVAIVTGYRRP